jgi:hypothetical protein
MARGNAASAGATSIDATLNFATPEFGDAPTLWLE